MGDAVWKGSEPGPALGTVGAKEGLVGRQGAVGADREGIPVP